MPFTALGAVSRFSNHRRFGGAVKAVGGSVDAVTAFVVSALRRHPLARLLLLAYLLSIHAFVYVLLGRMQHKSLPAPGFAGARHDG